jgi:hypothetical protein
MRLRVALAGLGIIGAALAAAPVAAAEGEPGANEPLLPGCEVTGGSAVLGGQTTDCASPGNVQIDATPEFIPGNMYGGFYGFPGFF